MVSKNPQTSNEPPSVLKHTTPNANGPQVTEHPIDAVGVAPTFSGGTASSSPDMVQNTMPAAVSAGPQPMPASEVATQPVVPQSVPPVTSSPAQTTPAPVPMPMMMPPNGNDVVNNQVPPPPMPSPAPLPVTPPPVAPGGVPPLGTQSPVPTPIPQPLPPEQKRELETKAKTMMKELGQETAAMKANRAQDEKAQKPPASGKGKHTAAKVALVVTLIALVGAGGIAGLTLLNIPGISELRKQADFIPPGEVTPPPGSGGGGYCDGNATGCWLFTCPQGCGGDGDDTSCNGGEPGASRQSVDCSTASLQPGQCGQIDAHENGSYCQVLAVQCGTDCSSPSPNPSPQPTPTPTPPNPVACTGVTGVLSEVNGSTVTTATILNFVAAASGSSLSNIELCFHGNFEGPGWSAGWQCLRDISPADANYPSYETDPENSDFNVNSGTGTFTYADVKAALVASGHSAAEIDQKGIRWGVNVMGASGTCMSTDTCGAACRGTFGLQPPAPTETPTPTPPPTVLACMGIDGSIDAPKLGDKVTYSCSGVPSGEVASANFQYSVDNGATWVSLANIANNPLQASLLVSDPVSYQVRCRVCDANASCTPWQSAGQ